MQTIPPKSFDILLQFRKATAVQKRNLMLEGGHSQRQQPPSHGPRKRSRCQNFKRERERARDRVVLLRARSSASACCANELITYNL